MLKIRVLTAAIGLPILILLFATELDIVLVPMFALFVGLSVYEVAAMTQPKLLQLAQGGSRESYSPTRLVSLGSVAVSVLAFLAFAGSPQDGRPALLVSTLLIVLPLVVFSSREPAKAGVACLASVFACFYGTLPWISIWGLYEMGEGSSLVMFLLAVVWAGDTGAYFGGLGFGKHKLSPLLSPKKTWEGAIFGAISSIAGGIAVASIYGIANYNYLWIAGVSLVGGIAGQLGDLVESSTKRFCEVKDSGAILPGHGGFLDRVDGLLFAGPVIWLAMFLHQHLAG